MPYTVGHNMTGYIPESEPYTFADYESAKRSLIDEMERDADHYDSMYRDGVDGSEYANGDAAEFPNYAEELSAACEELNLTSATDEDGGQYDTFVGNVHYWIMPTPWSDVDFDDDDHGDVEGLASAFLDWCEATQTDALSTFDITDDAWERIKHLAGRIEAQ